MTEKQAMGVAKLLFLGGALAVVQRELDEEWMQMIIEDGEAREVEKYGGARLTWSQLTSRCQADMEVEKYVGSFVEDDDMEPTDQPVPLGEQGMEVVKDDPRRRIARHAWSSLHCPCQQH